MIMDIMLRGRKTPSKNHLLLLMTYQYLEGTALGVVKTPINILHKTFLLGCPLWTTSHLLNMLLFLNWKR